MLNLPLLSRKPIRSAALLVLCSISANLSGAQEPKLRCERFVLPRDLTVVVHEDHNAPVVTVDIWYHAGSAHEVPAKTIVLAERHELPSMRMTMMLTPAELSAAAASFFHPKQLAWIDFGDHGKIEDGLKQMDPGPVHLLDTDGRVLP